MFQGRFLAGLWHRGGRSPILVASVYGFPQRDAAQLQALNEALLLVQELAEQRGAIPAIIGADLNTLLEFLPASAWFSACGWVDLNAPQATCLPSQGEARRIDCLLANRNLVPLLPSQALDSWTGSRGSARTQLSGLSFMRGRHRGGQFQTAAQVRQGQHHSQPSPKLTMMGRSSSGSAGGWRGLPLRLLQTSKKHMLSCQQQPIGLAQQQQVCRSHGKAPVR